MHAGPTPPEPGPWARQRGPRPPDSSVREAGHRCGSKRLPEQRRRVRPGTSQGSPGLLSLPPGAPAPSPVTLTCVLTMPGQRPRVEAPGPHLGESLGGAGAHLGAGEATFCDPGDGQALVGAPGQGQESHSSSGQHGPGGSGHMHSGSEEPAGSSVAAAAAFPAAASSPSSKQELTLLLSGSQWNEAQVGRPKPQPHDFPPVPARADGLGTLARCLWAFLAARHS